MSSLRRQLTRELLVAVVLLLCGGLAAVYIAARDAVTDQFDRALQAKARAISTLTSVENGRPRVTFTDRFMPGFEDYSPWDFFQLWDAEGDEIARSESLFPGMELPRQVGTLEHPSKWNFTLPDGRPARAAGFAFRPRGWRSLSREAGSEFQLVVASDRESLDRTLWQLLGLCGGIAALLVAATLWVIPRVLRRGLVPVNTLVQQATQIDAESLSTRFNVDRFPVELRPIAERLNELLGRLERSFERERQFSADLAHELRTPLAELRTQSECAIKWPESRDPELDRETLAIARQMERVVTHLLALTRGDQGQLVARIEPISLHDVATDVWSSFAARAAARRLVVAWEVAPCRGEADPGLLRSILANLLENAVDHATAGGSIQISTEAHAGGIALTIANTTMDLTAADVPKLFDRFWRKESARSGGQHLGLGLALSHSYARAMRWQLTARLDADRQLALILSGPGRIETTSNAPRIAAAVGL